MVLYTIIQILLIYHDYIFASETTDVFYDLKDFTPKNTTIGNLLYFKTNQTPNLIFDSAVLMNTENLFDLKTNGDIYSKIDIDRDQICVKFSCCRNFTCIINMKAYFFKKQSTSFNISIKIIDSNDNKPTFSISSSILNIPESSDLYSTFKLPVAIDLDSDRFGIGRYELFDSSQTFEIQMKTNEPYLRLLKPLDREKLDVYNLKMTVFDKHQPLFNNSLNLVVKISDVNDNAPYFVRRNHKTHIINSSEIFRIELKENQSTTYTIYNFHAQDDDEGENSKITYSISPIHSIPSDIVQRKFSIVSPYETAEIRLRESLDYEVKLERIITLVILATDNGKPAKSASVSLIISLIDINDNQPVITESNTKDISENDAESQQLKLFTVTDEDLISNKKISCNLMDETIVRFELQKYDWNVYGLFNKVAFDYEIRKDEIVRIICHDKADPEFTQTTNFVVNIKDKNDNVPQWSNSEYYYKIYENDKPDLNIITLTATDRDSSIYGKLFYNITEGSNDKNVHFIRINAFTGSIYMTMSIDREKFPQLQYTITVTDNYDNQTDQSLKVIHHSNSTKLIIDVMDKNDNPPRFKGTNRHFQITEDSAINTKIGKLYFDDVDEPPNNIVTMSLLDYDTHFQKTYHWFGIIDNDTIMVKNKLDREETGNISLIVQVVDHGFPPQTGTEKILIEILDVNDNYPVLTDPQNNSFVSIGGSYQTTEINTKLIQLKATDLDNGLNGTITFKLLQTNLTNPNDIKLNEITGTIYSNWKPYPGIEVGVYSLHILISDKGTPSLSSHIILYLNITSSNSGQFSDAHMSNIVILILIIVCSLALIVSLIAAIFWVRFRVSNDSPVTYQEEYFEREHLNKDANSHQYSQMTLDKPFRQNSYENNRLNPYESYQGFHHDTLIPSRNHTNYSHNTLQETLDKSRMAPYDDCLTVFGAIPAQCNRFDTSLSRLRHPIIPDLNSSFSGNLVTNNPKTFILQSYCENDYKTVANIQPATLMVEPNFSDSGKGGSVEDLNYRQFSGISTFTNPSFVNTSSANAKVFCQNSNIESNLNQCLYDKSSETMF